MDYTMAQDGLNSLINSHKSSMQTVGAEPEDRTI